MVGAKSDQACRSAFVRSRHCVLMDVNPLRTASCREVCGFTGLTRLRQNAPEALREKTDPPALPRISVIPAPEKIIFAMLGISELVK